MKGDQRPILILSAWALAVIVLMRLAPSITQNQEYHAFADRRTIFGIPNFWNVVSNFPFAVVGALGLWKTRGINERVLFGGVLLTCFGSAWYHLSPDDARLVWDRVPMTLAFMSIVAIILEYRFGPDWNGRLVLPLALFGAATVLWWRKTGNLSPYILVQFGSMLVLLVGILSDRRLRGLWLALALYVLAKIAESSDAAIYAAFPLSGHTLKHLLASLSAFFILRWREDGQ